MNKNSSKNNKNDKTVSPRNHDKPVKSLTKSQPLLKYPGKIVKKEPKIKESDEELEKKDSEKKAQENNTENNLETNVEKLTDPKKTPEKTSKSPLSPKKRNRKVKLKTENIESNGSEKLNLTNQSRDTNTISDPKKNNNHNKGPPKKTKSENAKFSSKSRIRDFTEKKTLQSPPKSPKNRRRRKKPRNNKTNPKITENVENTSEIKETKEVINPDETNFENNYKPMEIIQTDTPQTDTKMESKKDENLHKEIVISENIETRPINSPLEILNFIPRTLPPLESIKKYSASNLKIHRQYLLRELLNYSTSLSYEEAIEHLPPCLESLSRDNSENTRKKIAEIIPAILNFLLKKEDQKEHTQTHITTAYLPILSKLINDPDKNVMEEALKSIIEVSKMLSEPHVIHVLKLAEELSKENKEEGHVRALQILNGVSQYINKQTVMEVSLRFFQNLMKNESKLVRKTVVSSLGILTSIFGNEHTSGSLLPILVSLSKDTEPDVRKTCPESLVEISKYVQDDIRMDQVVSIFGELAKDSSRIVRVAASESLGPLVQTFNHPVPIVFLDYYRTFSTEPFPKGEGVTENEFTQFCAYNFPGILQCYGAEKWPDLSQTYSILVKDPQIKVRKSLSYSLYFVAEILGRKISEEDNILVYFENFLKDTEEVKHGVVKSYVKFLRIFSTEIREKYFQNLEQFLSEKNWRNRYSVAKQVGEIAEMLTIKQIEQWLLPFVFKLEMDPVAAVRKKSIEQLCVLLNIYLKNGYKPGNMDSFILQINNLAQNASYKNRLMFIKLCSSVAEILEKNLFEQIFAPLLLPLAKDKVSNVRMFVASFIKTLIQKEEYKNETNFHSILEELKCDVDKDVVLMAGGTVPPKQKKT